MRSLSRKQVFGLGPLVGSSPTASAFANVNRTNSPVVQRQRLLAYTQATMVRVHPGLLILHGQVFSYYVLAGQPGVPATLSRLETVGSNPIENAWRD